MSGLNQGSYTRTYGAPQAGRDSTFPRFHFEPVEDAVASAAAGRPIFTQQERVQIIQPGNPNQPVLLVTDEHRNRWPDQYERFRRGEAAGHGDGTPIEQWPVLSRAMVLEMKALELHTVEQIAGMSDHGIQKIGLGGRRIVELANAYLDEAKQMSITTDALARADRAEGRIAGLEKQNAENRALLDQMHAQLLALKNAPSAADAYIPAQVVAPAPSASTTTSALDGLAEHRGRPRKVA